MNHEQITQYVQSIVNSVQNTGLFIVRSLFRVSSRTFRVEVSNHQKEIKVSGNVAVDQSTVEKQLQNVSLAIRELKNTLKPLKEVTVSNMVKIPEPQKFPEFPTKFHVTNMPQTMGFSNIKEITTTINKVVDAFEKLDFSPKIEVTSPKVNVPAPIVNVPRQSAPIVNVAAPDMKELGKIMKFLQTLDAKHPLPVRLSDGKSFYKALERMADIYAGSSASSFQNSDGSEGRGMLNRHSEVKVTVNDTWDANDIDKASSTVTYFGEQTIDGDWRVRKVTKSGTLTSIRHATSRNNNLITSYTQAWDDRTTLEYGYANEL